MAREWADLGNGRKKLTITDDQGRVEPRVLYGTEQEILDKLCDTAVNGDVRIKELKTNGAGKGLSADKRLQVVADLKDPGKVEEAVTAVVESVIGQPIAELRQERRETQQERTNRLAAEAATAFADSTSEWYPSPYNRETLVAYMRRMGLNPTKVEDYRTAFAELIGANLLQLSQGQDGAAGDGSNQPEAPATTTERTAPAPTAQPKAPTRFSTGIRRNDVSGEQPRPTNRLKYTREQIFRMSAATMKEKMNDPEFIKASEFYAAEDAKKQRRRTG